ncbi:hypothetical protein GEOBRER4_n2157 [Citrifermentans bremense]|uniref:Uncharacterized protein n=1 Tax=Citrifermentans bremense TaxID=60035 RepID=A0A7R7FSU7_9BACT|nr:hypothetical protein GEOBRER4_n2157 [Citrifermentans bremense]
MPATLTTPPFRRCNEVNFMAFGRHFKDSAVGVFPMFILF